MNFLMSIKHTFLPTILLTSSIATADIVTVEFKGTIYDAPTVLAPQIFSGDTFRGIFAYDTNATNNNHFDGSTRPGEYWDSYTQIALRLGSYELSIPNAQQVSNLGIIHVTNDYDSGSPGFNPDGLGFQVGNINVQGQQHALFGNEPIVNGYHLQSLLLGFGNMDGSALTSSDLPSSFDPNKFIPTFVGFYFNSGDGQFDMGTPLPTIWGTASITKVTTAISTASQVPLPGAAWLMGSCLLFLINRNRQIHRRIVCGPTFFSLV